MGESLKSQHEEPPTLMGFAEGKVHVGPDTAPREGQMLQVVLALHHYAHEHEADAGGINFSHPELSDKRVRNAAMVEWLGDLGPDTLRGRFSAFMHALQASGEQYGDVDITNESEREKLLRRIEDEAGLDPSTQHVQ